MAFFDYDPKEEAGDRLIHQAQTELQRAYVKSGLRQQGIATILGVDRSVINRRLKDSSNLTVRSLAEMAYAMGATPEVRFLFAENLRNDGATAQISGSRGGRWLTASADQTPAAGAMAGGLQRVVK